MTLHDLHPRGCKPAVSAMLLALLLSGCGVEQTELAQQAPPPGAKQDDEPPWEHESPWWEYENCWLHIADGADRASSFIPLSAVSWAKAGVACALGLTAVPVTGGMSAVTLCLVPAIGGLLVESELLLLAGGAVGLLQCGVHNLQVRIQRVACGGSLERQVYLNELARRVKSMQDPRGPCDPSQLLACDGLTRCEDALARFNNARECLKLHESLNACYVETPAHIKARWSSTVEVALKCIEEYVSPSRPDPCPQTYVDGYGWTPAYAPQTRSGSCSADNRCFLNSAGQAAPGNPVSCAFQTTGWSDHWPGTGAGERYRCYRKSPDEPLRWCDLELYTCPQYGDLTKSYP